MKKFLYLLMALPLLGFFTSCDDDDNMPNVRISIDYGNATVVDNAVYVVKPDTLKVLAVTVKAVNTDHNATLGPVTYSFDGVPSAVVPVSPYPVNIATKDIPVGSHVLELSATVAEEGCSLATIAAAVKVNVVENASDIPDSGGGTTTRMENAVYTLK